MELGLQKTEEWFCPCIWLELKWVVHMCSKRAFTFLDSLLNMWGKYGVHVSVTFSLLRGGLQLSLNRLDRCRDHLAAQPTTKFYSAACMDISPFYNNRFHRCHGANGLELSQVLIGNVSKEASVLRKCSLLMEELCKNNYNCSLVIHRHLRTSICLTLLDTYLNRAWSNLYLVGWGLSSWRSWK